MDYICFISPTTSHSPYPGVAVTANSADEAAVKYAELASVPMGTRVCVVQKDAFVFFKLSGAAQIPAPAYT
jgi:hypothetical protein